MARNPVVNDPAREQRVRECAYHLWEADGKPHGHDVEYWERARELVGSAESTGNDRVKTVNTVASAVAPAGKGKTPAAPAPSKAEPDEVPTAPAKRRSGTAAKRPKS